MIISRVNPLQYLMTRPTLSGRLARWSMILSQFDITFVPSKAIKGQALADFLAAHPLPADSPLNDDLPDEPVMSLEGTTLRRWELYFDGASSAVRGIDRSQNFSELTSSLNSSRQYERFDYFCVIFGSQLDI